jgi:hypothetical protein
MSTPLPGLADGLDVGLLDGTALAQVVAHQKGGPHRLQRRQGIGRGWRAHLQARQDAPHTGHRLGAAGQLHGFVAPIGAQAGAGVHGARRLRHLRHHRALHGHGKVQPGAVRPAVVQVVAVVDEVDAANEALFTIDHAQLLVQPAQLARVQQSPPPIQRPEHHQLHASGIQPAAQGRQRGHAAEAVDHHTHLHAAPGGVGQGPGHGLGSRVVMEDVGGQPHAVAGSGDGRAHGGEQRVAAGQQLHPVATGELGRGGGTGGRRVHQSSRSSTSSGKWSDMRAQPLLRGTVAETQARPRV